ncbi:hypothetical protein BT69DRAFT_1287373 [Atractiella rhizophila]|nr:hypothetical protein BT69DRAFT_1287373 [Atractiella rhizophila]
MPSKSQTIHLFFHRSLLPRCSCWFLQAETYLAVLLLSDATGAMRDVQVKGMEGGKAVCSFRVRRRLGQVADAVQTDIDVEGRDDLGIGRRESGIVRVNLLCCVAVTERELS